jgi:hypothetical protein
LDRDKEQRERLEGGRWEMNWRWDRKKVEREIKNGKGIRRNITRGWTRNKRRWTEN